MLGGAEQFDDFGDALSAGDLNGDGSADLAVGVPREDIGTIDSPGRVNMLYGGAGGLSAAGNQLWDQDSAGVLDAVERGDQFGFALAAG